MDETLILRSIGRVTILISRDVAEWHDAELLNAARDLDELIFSLETGEPIKLFVLATRQIALDIQGES